MNKQHRSHILRSVADGEWHIIESSDQADDLAKRCVFLVVTTLRRVVCNYFKCFAVLGRWDEKWCITGTPFDPSCFVVDKFSMDCAWRQRIDLYRVQFRSYGVPDATTGIAHTEVINMGSVYDVVGVLARLDFNVDASAEFIYTKYFL